MRVMKIGLSLLLLVTGSAMAANCEGPANQAEIAATARDRGIPQAMFTAQMPPLDATASGPTKQGWSILRDVYTLKDLDPATHTFVRARICELGGQSTSAADFDKSVKKAILDCQTDNADPADRAACIREAIPASAVSG